jgi:cell volume regulation protein A
VEHISQVLLVAAVLLYAAIALSPASQRLGVPSLLVFLAVGLMATELPGAPPVAISIETAALIGNLALAIILLDGGLRTRFGTLRMVAGPALTLATVGVLLTASAVGAVAVALLGLTGATASCSARSSDRPMRPRCSRCSAEAGCA